MKKYITVLGKNIDAEKLKVKALQVLREAGIVLISLVSGFVIWILLSVSTGV
jgi:hypothetical protein